MLVLRYKFVVYAHHVSEDVFLLRHGIEAEIESVYLGHTVVVFVSAKVVDVRRNLGRNFRSKRSRKLGVIFLLYELSYFVVVLEFIYVRRYERRQIDNRFFPALLVVLFGAAEQICLKRKSKSANYKIVARAVKLVGMVFADRVRHHNLVVELYVAELRMRLRAIDVAVEKHHEVRRYLVDVSRVFRHDRNFVADVDRNRRQKLVIAPFF